jgi:hypothetical protein
MGGQGRRALSCVLAAPLLCALIGASPAGADTISAGDVQVGESGSATFTLTRDAGFLDPATTVSYHTVDGSAGSPSDYTATSGTVSFDGVFFGTTQRGYVNVAIRPDALNENSETFRLVVAGPGVADGDATATIVDDDPVPALSVADSPAVTEGAAGAKASFVVRLSAPSGRDVSVRYATANASATAGQDYTAASGTLVLPAGSMQAPIGVGVLDDAADEPAESFELHLFAALGATIAKDSAAATIVDDDQPPAPAPPAADPKPPATTSGGVQQPASPATRLPATGAAGPSGATGSTTGSSTRTSLGLSEPRLKRPWTVLLTVSCPQSAGRCGGRITLLSIANRRSRLAALRKERRLGRLTFSLQGGHAQTLALALGRGDRSLLARTGRMRVRAYAVTQDAAGRAGVRSVSGTLIARTAHSSPSRKPS